MLVELQEYSRGRTIPVYEGVSKKTAKAIADHNQRVGATDKAIAANEGQLDEFRSGESLHPWNATLTAEEVRINRGFRLETVHHEFTAAVELCEAAADELAKLVDPLRDELEKVTAAVRKGLTDIGSGVEAQQAWPVNPESAERQLDHLVKTNTRTRAAQGRVNDAQNRALAATAKVKELNTAHERLRGFLSKLAERAAAGV